MLSNKNILENLCILMLIVMCVCVLTKNVKKNLVCVCPEGWVCLKTSPADVIFANSETLWISRPLVALIFIDLNLDITFPFLLSFYLKFYFSLRQINNAKIDKTLLIKRKSD